MRNPTRHVSSWVHALTGYGMRVLGPILVIMLVISTSLHGCKDDPNLDTAPWLCAVKGRPSAIDTPCPGNQRYANGVCVENRCDSAGANPCCPGTSCRSNGACELIPAAQVTTCTNDTECLVNGHACLTRPGVSKDSKTCGFAPVGADGTCPSELAAFNTRCVGDPPCGGSCNAGFVCNIDLNVCERPKFTDSVANGCMQSCSPGQLLVYTDPNAMLFEQCCDIKCHCATLPPLFAGQWGRYSDVAASDNGVLVSSYNSTFGDVVLSTHRATDGQMTHIAFLDGVPATGTIKGDTNGPRRGIIEPGPNVGLHTALAVSQNQPRVAYFDVDRNRLKFAAFDAARNAWDVSVIDDGSAGGPPDTEPATPRASNADTSVGTYPAVVVDTAGIAHVTYFAERSARGGRMMTTPMYARAKNTAPKKPSDWDVVAVDATFGCSDACTGNQVCAMNGDTPQCVNKATACGACRCGSTCVQTTAGPACRAQLPAQISAAPCGGLCNAGDACVADAHGVASCLTIAASDCSPTCTSPQVCVRLPGQSAASCQNQQQLNYARSLSKGVGLFTSLALVGNRVWVVYYDNVHGQLRGATANFDTGASVSAGFSSQVLKCDAKQDIGQHAAIAVSPAGNRIAIVYQGDKGKNLYVYQGSNLTEGTTQVVDNGVRDTRLHVVGAYASPAFASDGTLYIAYADQTNNDLVVAYPGSNGTWTRNVVLSDGAFGSFADLAIAQDKAYLSTYKWDQRHGKDSSRLQVRVMTLSELRGGAPEVPVRSAR